VYRPYMVIIRLISIDIVDFTKDNDFKIYLRPYKIDTYSYVKEY